MADEYSKRLDKLEKIIGTNVSDTIYITLENGKRERWADIDLILSVFDYPALPIQIPDPMTGKTELSESNLPVEYEWTRNHLRGLSQYQQWLVYWLGLMKDTAEKRRKGK